MNGEVRTIRRYLLILLLLPSTALASGLMDTLRVGDMAPPLVTAAWLRGDSLVEFRRGITYVIDLGYVSCGPCRAAIPQLSAIAMKYKGRVEVISVHVYENKGNRAGTDYIQKVRNFVSKQGDRIAYSVAVDDITQTTARTWYEPAARHISLGFPTAFIVDGNGRIAWIGPGHQIGTVLDDLVGSRINGYEAEVVRKEYKEVYRRIFRARNNHDYSTALFLIDSLIAVAPQDMLYALKFSTLIEYDSGQAYEYGRELLSNQCNHNEASLTMLTRSVVTSRAASKDLYELVIYMTDRALVLSSTETVTTELLEAQAWAFAAMREYARAAQALHRALKSLDQDKYSSMETREIARSNMLSRLSEYERKVH